MEESVRFSMMAAEDLMDMPARPANGKLEDFGKDLDLEALLLDHRRQQRSRAAVPLKRESELNIIRSAARRRRWKGGGTPSVASLGILTSSTLIGSMAVALGRSDRADRGRDEVSPSLPALLLLERESESEAGSNGKVNPRLPASAVAKEDWSVPAQRLQLGASAVCRIGDRRKVVEENNGSGSSLFSVQPGLPQRDMDGELANLRTGSPVSLARQPSADWVRTRNGDLIGSMSNGLGTRSKSFADALQAMMKDQFGNYVVQKVVETCDDQNRELILSRIKAHVNALKT